MDPAQDQQQSTPKQQVTERLRQANNVLITVPANPSVDELAATIGLTLMLNKLEKHATAVFSGTVPSTLEFLKPEETIETNTDSLRDFIVSLDKSKADKLRYKVEENVVKIFITPYRTSITQDDLEFTQGDFNVDVVVALGVSQRDELDQVITAHGRILHDATVIGVTAGQELSEIGQINWQDAAASSLSEMLVSISEALKGGLIDEQIATAFLTGIVAETERFSNPKTTPKVMTMAAQLMAAGANQQLIANELEKAVEVSMPQSGQAADPAGEPQGIPAEDGTLNIPRTDEPALPEPQQPPQQPQPPQGQPLDAANAPGTPEQPRAPEPAQTELPQPEQQPESEPLLPPSQTRRRQFLSEEPEQKSDDDFYNPLLGSAPSESSERQPEGFQSVSQPSASAQQMQSEPPAVQPPAAPEPVPAQPPVVPVAAPEPAPAPPAPEPAPAPAPEPTPESVPTEPVQPEPQPPAGQQPVAEPQPQPEPPAQPEAPPEPEQPAAPAADTEQDKSVLPPPPAAPDIADGQIHIDAEGNIIRKTDVNSANNPADNPPASEQPTDNKPASEQPEQGSEPDAEPPASGDATLADLEASVQRSQAPAGAATAGLSDARDAVISALAGSEPSLDTARTDLNAMPLSAPAESTAAPFDSFRLGSHDKPVASPAIDVSGNLQDSPAVAGQNEQPGGMAPPPVPPPMFPQ